MSKQTRTRAPAVPDEDWQRVQPFIKSNYDSMTLQNLLDKLQEEFGVSLTSRQLNYRLSNKLKLRKYNKNRPPRSPTVDHHAPSSPSPSAWLANQVTTQLSEGDQIKKAKAELLHALAFDRYAFPIYNEICKAHEPTLGTIHVSWYRTAETAGQIDEVTKRIEKLAKRAQPHEIWLLSMLLARLQDRKAVLDEGASISSSAEDGNIRGLMNGLLASPDFLRSLPTPCEGFDLVIFNLISIALDRMKDGQPDDFVANAQGQFLLGHLSFTPEQCVAKKCLLWMKKELQTLNFVAVTNNFEIDLVLNLWHAAVTLPSKKQPEWLITTGPMLNISWVELLYTLCFMVGNEADPSGHLVSAGGMTRRANSGVGELLGLTHIELWEYICQQFNWTNTYDPPDDDEEDQELLFQQIQQFANDTLRKQPPRLA